MNWPPPLDGNSPLHRWLNRMLAAAKAGMPLNSRDALVERTPDGSRLSVKFPPPPNRPFFHPFKIYNVPHPTDPTKNRFTFQVRGGYIGMRPRHINVRGFAQEPIALVNNYEYRYVLSLGGTDGAIYADADPGLGYLTSDDTVDFYNTRTKTAAFVTTEIVNVGNSGDFGVSNTDNAGIFVIDSANDDVALTGPGASFWVEIDDSTPDMLPTVQVKCRMVTTTGGGGLGRATTFFPSHGIKCIPLGYVFQRYGEWGTALVLPDNLTITQLVYEHQLGRYGRGFPTGALPPTLSPETPVYWLGEWDDAIHKDTYMYPGDAVTVDDVFPVDGGAGLSVTLPALYVAADIFKAPAAPPGTGPWIRAAA